MILSWHKQLWDLLSEQRLSGCLPHALMFHGPAGTGKRLLAQQFAGRLLCSDPTADNQACGRCRACQLIIAGTHPDLSVIQPLPPENTKSQQPVLSIRIDAVRALCQRLADTSQFGGYRVAIIEGADRMVVQAANALLKTLEEPGKSTLMMLITDHPSRLPATIRSRCQALRFRTPAKSEAMDWLIKQDIKPELAGQWLNYAHGSPLKALQCAGTELDARQLLAEALFASQKGRSSLEYASQLAAIPVDLGLPWLMEWLIDLVKIKQCGTGGSIINETSRARLSSLGQKADSRKIFDLYDQVSHYTRKDRIALNSQLLWENLLISWENL